MSDDRPNRYVTPDDFEKTLAIVRETRLPAPQIGILEDATKAVCINEQWVSHVLSALDALASWWVWLGEDDDSSFGTQEIQRLMSALVNSNGCCDDCEDEFCMTISQEIINDICQCVADSTTTISNKQTELENLLNQVLQGQQQSPVQQFQQNPMQPQPTPQEILSESIRLNEGETCNNDNAYAVAVALIFWLDKTALDFFDDVIAAANVAEYVDEFVSGLPIGGSVYDAFLGMLDFVTEIDNWGKQAYEAAWSITLADEMECRLFNVIACQNCAVSIDDVIQVYEDKISETLGSVEANLTFARIAQEIGSAVVGNSDLAALLVHYSILQSIRFANVTEISKGGYNEFVQEVLKARDETNNDWSIECGMPVCEWQYTWENGDSTDIFQQFTGSFLNGFVYEPTSITADFVPNDPASSWNLHTGVGITRCEIDYKIDIQGNNNTFVRLEMSGQVSPDARDDYPSDGQYTGSLVITGDGAQSNAITQLRVQGLGNSYQFTVMRYTVRGFGVNPFE